MAVARATTSSIVQGFPKSRSLLAGNPQFDPSATWFLARYTATGGETSFTFSSIPQTYTSLQLRVLVRDTQAVNGQRISKITFNGVGGTSYNQNTINGNGSSVTAGASNGNSYLSPTASMGASATANVFGAGIMDIQDYTNTTNNKTAKWVAGSQDKANAGVGISEVGSGVFVNTSAITSVTVSAITAFVAGSTFALYGVL